MSILNGLARLGAVAAVAAILMGPALAADDAWVTKPFNGKDLEGWKSAGKDMGFWQVGAAKLDANAAGSLVVSKPGTELINAIKAGAHGVDLRSVATYGDQIVKIDVMVPKGSNSGIYLQGEYEVQVLDSFGKDDSAGKGDMGAVYNKCAPKGPHYKKPGEWQTFEIHFQAPKFDADGKKTASAKFIKVVLNGDTIVENFDCDGPTGGGVDNKEKAMGPIMFQGNHGSVSFRNLSIEPLKK
jgi:hypothetical protein